ncbi:MAG: PKD domain-containing protein [Flavobacteriales bacterium]|nr:PKD domain-containing protein [Flavobacteriales bacterium]
MVCVGDTGAFWPDIPGIAYDWDFGGSTNPNTYNTSYVGGVQFNTPGTYDVTLRVSTDCCGWTNKDTITIIVDAKPTITLTGNTEICKGDNTTLTVTTNGDSIHWSPFIGLNTDTGAVVVCNANDTVNYVITVQSTFGQCSADTTLQVNVNETPDLSNTSTVGSTCGNDGSATVTPTGGSGNYTYQWNDPANQITGTANNLYTGNYSVTVTDLNTGCLDSTFVFVPNSNAPMVYIANANNPLCYNGVDGSAYAGINNGTGPFTYTWLDGGGATLSSGVGLDSLVNVSEGTYTVSITDANGCVDDFTFTLNHPDSVYGIITDSTNATCYGLFDGMLEVQGDGGVGNFSYQWDDPDSSTTQLVDSLDNGTYTVTITDGNGCTNTLTITFPVVGAMPIVIDPGVDDTVCGATHNLNAVPSALNGHWILNSGPGNITFNPSMQDPNASAFVSQYGLYELLWVEDNGACSDTGSVEVLFVEQPIADAGNLFGSVCGLDHNLSAVPSAGTGTWSIIAGASTVTFNPNVNSPNVSVQFGAYGVYTLEWTEDNGFGCVSSDQINITTVNFNVNGGSGDTICGNQYTFNAVALGNNGHWIQEGGPGTTNYSPSNGSPTATATASLYGIYDYAWVEDNGVCYDTARISVQYVEMPVANAGSVVDTVCGLTANLNAIPSVGTGSWSLVSGAGTVSYNPGTASASTSLTLSAFGNYTFEWTENNGHGCINSDQVSFVAFNQVTPFIITPDTFVGCLPRLEVNFSNYTDTTDLLGVFWDFDDGTYSQLYEPTHTFTGEGCYDITLTSKTRLGCNIDTTYEDLICVYPLPDPDFYADPPSGTITDNWIQLYNESTGAVDYVWEIEGSDTLIYEFEPRHPFPNDPGIYSVCLTAITDKGCEATTCDDIEIKDVFSIYVPTAFTPNGNNRNDRFFPVMNGVLDKDYQFIVFNRWGDVIFQSTKLGDSWDGTVMQGGQKAQAGVYIWKVVVTDIEELYPGRTFTGHVTLMR